MAEKESDMTKSPIFLKEETRDVWDKWVMLAEPYAQSKGFWRALTVLSPNLHAVGASAYMEGDHVTMVAPDGVTETDATDAQKRAYKANAMAENYMMLCLKHMPELQ